MIGHQNGKIHIVFYPNTSPSELETEVQINQVILLLFYLQNATQLYNMLLKMREV